MAFVRLGKAQEMLGIGAQVHEIAIKFTDAKFGQDKTIPFWGRYSQHGQRSVKLDGDIAPAASCI